MANCVLKQKDNSGADFTDCDFSKKDLSGYSFKNCILVGTNFSNCTFDTTTDFTGAVFGASSTGKSTSFSGCTLSSPKFSIPANFGAKGEIGNLTDLSKATIPWELLGSTSQFLNLTDAIILDMPTKVNGFVLEHVIWTGFDFSNKNLYNAHFIDCDLSNCNFSNAILDFSSFLGICNLTEVKFNFCSLNSIVFTRATLTNTDFSYAKNFNQCSFENALLKGTIFDGNDLTNSTFSTPAKLSDDINYITSFQFATLSSEFLFKNLMLNWQFCDLRNVNVPDLHLITSKLYKLNAQGSFFNNTISFNDANLNGANFRNTVFNSSNFQSANLNNADFTSAKTQLGSVMGIRGIIFLVSQVPTNNRGKGNANFTDLLNDLESNSISNVIKIFSNYGYTINSITIEKNNNLNSGILASWIITDQTTKRIFQIDKCIAANQDSSDKLELLVFEQSPTDFTNAQLIGSFFESADLFQSKMVDASLFGSKMTYCNLAHVDMTGANLGDNRAIFTVAKKDSSTDPADNYSSFLAALSDNNLVKIIQIFSHFGFIISGISLSGQGTLSKPWIITDQSESPERHFSVINDNSKQEISVFLSDAAATILDYSYMPGTILDRANLTGCSAQNVHLYDNYGENVNQKASLTGSTLTNVLFNNSNLYNVNFDSAVANGASFTNANLINATFKNTELGPSKKQNGVSFESANLQGVSFPSSTLVAANLSNAAISLSISETNSGSSQQEKTNGVWLFEIPQSEDISGMISNLDSASQTYSIVQPAASILASKFLINGTISPVLLKVLSNYIPSNISEKATIKIDFTEDEPTWKITDGSTIYSFIPGFNGLEVSLGVFEGDNPEAVAYINYDTSSLNSGSVPESLKKALSKASNGSISLSPNAILSKYPRPTVWDLSEAPPAFNYTLWWAAILTGRVPAQKIVNVINARVSFLNSLVRFFNKFEIDLHPQTTVTPIDNLPSEAKGWLIDLGSQNPYYLKTGYIKFKVIAPEGDQSKTLNVYGFQIRLTGQNFQGQQYLFDQVFGVSKLSQQQIDTTTLLPNNQTKQQNNHQNVPYYKWMRIYKNQPPAPPVCAPTEISYCPAPVKGN